MTAALVAAALCVPAAAKRTVAQKKQIARTQFETAERLRDALNGRPEKERTRRAYQQVIDAYRSVYYLAPTSNKADASVMAVAELLAEVGRRFNDPKASRAAIGQFEFLRREYPGSRFRADALFNIAQIYKDDLEDTAQAKAAFSEFLKRYPRNESADEAHQALADMDKPAKPPAKEAKEPAKPAVKEAKEKDKPEETAKQPEPRPRTLVTGIRHWSTPDGTRLAIDLQSEVEYEAGRVPNPDRLFFDLHNTKLASTLVGKSLDVDDGFVHKIRIGQFQPGETRVVLDVGSDAEYSAFFLPNPSRLIIDIKGKRPVKPAEAKLKETVKPKVAETAASRPAPAREIPRSTREPKPAPPPAVEIVAKVQPPELPPVAAPKPPPAAREAAKKAPVLAAEPAPKPKPGKVARKAPEPAPGREAKPTANGERSLVRALGLKIGRIVVDAGHGGHDTGTIGPNGLTEKDLVLDVALRLGKLLQNRMGAEVVYTRDDDTFIPLETRTAIANQNAADLFISVHANSSRDTSARGVETYYLNFTTSADALEVAARENAVSEKSIHELQDLVKKIALKDKIEESREFAADVQQSLYAGLASRGLKNRGVKKAPFIVLIGANMPSILAEISFVSNPGDAKRLKTADYRQRIAESLYRGIARYVSGLSGLKVASKVTRPAEQDSSR